MKSTATQSDTCLAMNKNGTPCIRPHLPDSKYCFSHDPNRAAERAQIATKAAKAKALLYPRTQPHIRSASDFCKATRKDGKPCTMPHLPDSRYCGHHDPRLAEMRYLRSSRGGKARHHHRLYGEIDPVKVRTNEDILINGEKVIADLWANERSIARDKAVISALQLLMKAQEAGSVEDRLQRLEAAMYGSENQEPVYEIEQIEPIEQTEEKGDTE